MGGRGAASGLAHSACPAILCFGRSADIDGAGGYGSGRRRKAAERPGEVYVNNTARVDAASSKIPRDRGPATTLDDDDRGAGVVHDAARPGAVLWRPGPRTCSPAWRNASLAGLVTILWWICGYSLVFADGAGALLGELQKFAFLKGVDSDPNTDYAYWVSHNVFSMYQLMFAIITPALIVGAIAERMKFSAILLFVTLWMFIVYFPLAHMVWGIDGLMNGVWNANAKIKAIDFAGGTVVHMSSGWSALDPLPDPGQAPGLRQRTHAAAQHGALHGRHRHALGRLVRLQRRQRRGRRRHRRQRLHDHHARDRGGVASPGPWRNGCSRGKPSMLGFCSGAVGGSGRHHARLRASSSTTGAVIIGVLAGADPVLRLHEAQELARLRRRARHLRRARRRRNAGRVPDRRPRDADVNANLATNLKDIVGKTLWLEQLKAIGLTLVPGRCRHRRHRLHRQGRHRSASDAARTKRPASTSPTTASAATTTWWIEAPIHLSCQPNEAHEETYWSDSPMNPINDDLSYRHLRGYPGSQESDLTWQRGWLTVHGC